MKQLTNYECYEVCGGMRNDVAGLFSWATSGVVCTVAVVQATPAIMVLALGGTALFGVHDVLCNPSDRIIPEVAKAAPGVVGAAIGGAIGIIQGKLRTPRISA